MMPKLSTAAQSAAAPPKPSKAQSLMDVLSSDKLLAMMGQSNPIMDELYACRELLNARYGSVHNVVQHTT
jgi:hypothetical protein